MRRIFFLIGLILAFSAYSREEGSTYDFSNGSLEKTINYDRKKNISPSGYEYSTKSQNNGVSIAVAKSQCADLGFTTGTEKFGDCVLKLIDMSNSNAGNVSNQSATTQAELEAKHRELLELQIQRQKNLERDRKYDNAIDALKSIQNNLPR